MTTRHAQLGLAKPASARAHVLAARVNFSIDSEADREKKSPCWRSRRGCGWLCGGAKGRDRQELGGTRIK